MTLASHWDRGTQGRQRSKGRSLPGYGLTRLSGGASEVLGRAAWAPVLHLLLGHSESPAWPPSHSDNRKVNTPPPPGLRSGQRGSGAARGAPPGWDSLPGVIYTLAGGMALVVPLFILLHWGAYQGQWKTGEQKIKWTPSNST